MPRYKTETTQRQQPHDLRWWSDKAKPHDKVSACVDKLAKDARRNKLLLWRDLFLDSSPESDDDKKRLRAVGVERPGMRARFNVIRNACETLAARIGKSQPDPWVVTSGADWKLQRKAKAMTKFLQGEFSRLDYDNLSDESWGIRLKTLLDALIFGTGAIKVYDHHGKPAWQRTWRGNLLTDKREEMAGSVRTLYEVRAIDRMVLRDMFPEAKKQIDRLLPINMELFPAEDDTDDLVAVFEAWRRPNGPESPGRHCIVADGVTLHDDMEWERGFPFAWIHATIDPMRFWGVGYPERLAGLQSEQNEVCESISDHFRLIRGMWACEQGAELSADDFTNEIGQVIRYSGTPPQFLQPPPVHPQEMQYAAQQRQDMLHIEGIDPLESQGQKPAGLNSGKALRIHHDISSGRHVLIGQANERLTVQLANLMIELCEEIVDNDEDAELVAYTGDKVIEEVKYSDVRLGDHPYEARVYPVSALANSPQGRLEQLNEMFQVGLISPQEWRELADLPDLDRATQLSNAGRELSRKLIESALDGKATAATRVCDLAFLVEQGWREHALAQLHGATDDDMEALVRLLGHAQNLIDQQAAQAQAEMQAQQQAMQAPAQPMPAAAGGGPMPGPQGVVQ